MIRIYKTTNLVNNKIYIGQTNCKRVNYIGSGKLLLKSINKYGKNNFKCETIIEGDFNQKLTDELERHYIRLHNSNNPKIGYNLELGGLRGVERGVKSNKGYKHSDEYKLKCRLRQLGKIPSMETRKKLSEISKGKPKSDTHRENIKKSWILRKEIAKSKQKPKSK